MEVKAILFDTRSIQQYIFAGNKLKTNIGASYIVDRLFSDVLIDGVLNRLGYGIEKDAWKTSSALAIETDASVRCEVGYIGGGNALVLFQPEEDTAVVIREFTREVLLKYPGLLTGAAAGTLCLGEGKEKFQSSLDELYKKLKENQNRYAPVTSIPYTGLTVPCKLSGGTADIWDRNMLSGEKEFVDAGIMAKLQETALMAKDAMTERFHDILAGKFAFPDSLEDLGQIETEDYVAIVHIDGNNMGIRFGACKDFMERKKLSLAVAEKCQKSFGKLLQSIISEYDAQKENKSFGFKQCGQGEGSKWYLPIRPLILGGDDVTFVCMGRLALEYTRRYISYMEADEGVRIDCCGGIAILNTSYPFFRGYEMAEQLCGEAKKRSRREKKMLEDKEKKKAEDISSSWLDFALLHGEQAPDISDIRSQEYSGVLGNMHFGPYKVFTPASNSANKRYDIEKLLAGIRLLPQAMANNKIKELRAVLARDAHAMERFVEQLCRNGGSLPLIEGWESYSQQLWCREAEAQEMATPYVDMIEMMKFTDDTGRLSV